MDQQNTKKTTGHSEIISSLSLEKYAVLDNIAEHITIHNPQMQIIWANQAAGDSIGVDQSELIGQSCYELWHHRREPCPNCPVVRALKTGESQQSEIGTPDGRMWNIRSYPIRDEDSQIIGAVELTQDITQQKKAEHDLIESEKNYRNLFDSSLVGWWRTRINDGMFLKLNPAAVRALGFQHESELVGQYTALEFYPREEREEFLGLLKKLGQVDSFEAHFTPRDGSRKTVLLSARIYPDIGIIEGSVIDMTDHKSTLEALSEAVEKHSELYDNLRDGAASVDMTGRIIECNTAFQKMLGYSKEEIFKLTYNDITPEKWHTLELGILEKQVLKRGYSDNYEKEYRHKDGSIFPVELRTYLVNGADGNPTGMWAFVRDITKRKRAEKTRSVLMKITEATNSAEHLKDYLKIVHEQIKRLINAENSYVALYDHKSGEYSFPYCVDQKGPEPIPPTEEMKKSLTDYVRHTGKPLFVDPEIKKKLADSGEAFMVGRESKYWLGVPLITARGVIGVVAVHSYSEEYAYSSEDLELLAFVSGHIALAIERIRAEELLKRSEQKYRGLVEKITEGMCIVDLEEKIVFANSAACEIYGYSHDELMSMNLLELIVPEEHERILTETRNRKNGETSRYEFSIRRKDGEVRDLVVVVTPYQNMDGEITGGIGLFSDITEKKKEKKERKKLKQQLERAQRMESLGVLAGGVAHDLNNILGPLVAYPEMILMKLPAESPARRQVELLGKSAREAADVIQDLLTLARRGRYEMKSTSINEVIDSFINSATMVELQTRNPNVRVDVNLDRKAGGIFGSAPHLQKVIMNLVVNAFDAMPDGGKLTIESNDAHLDKLLGGYDNIDKTDYFIVKVIDTGIGIEEKNLKRIFEPYYSKKEMGSSGSGLGLSVVYGIVKDHKGYYDINSTPSAGTEFILYFPLCDVNEDQHIANEEKFDGCETVLVIDDVEEQREIARELLSSLGYRVSTVNNGREAIKYLKTNSTDIIILDMIMEKDFDGLDTYEEILKIHPAQKAVIVSGFSATDRVNQMMELGAGEYIKKPYSLRQRVNQMMELGAGEYIKKPYSLRQLGLAIRNELDKDTSPAIQ